MVGKQENLVALRGAGARRLAKTETGSARTSVRNRTRVARRGSAIAPWFPGQVAEGKCGSRGIQSVEPAAQSGRVRDSVRILEMRRRALPATTLHEVAAQRRTAGA